MKKIILLVMVVLVLGFSFACSKQNKRTGAQYQQLFEESDFNPDFYDGVMYDDLINLLGPIPKPEGELKLGYVAKAFENEYWRAVKEGAEDESSLLIGKNINVIVDTKAAQGESDDQGQLAIMTSMINQGYDGLLLSPITDANLEPGIESAFDKNIPMVNVVGGLATSVPAYVGPRHIQSGELAAQWVANKIGPSGGQVAVIIGISTAGAARARTQGFVEWFPKNAPEFEVVDTQSADWDRLKAQEAMEVWLKVYPNLKAVYANNDTMALGALEAVKNAGKLGEIFVIGNDGTKEAYESIKNGELSATVNIFPFYNSKMGIDILLRIIGRQEVPRVVWTTQALIDSTNVDQLAKDVVGWKGLQFTK